MSLGIRKLNLSSRMINVAKISSGTIIGQAITIVTLPVITRIYGAKIMGIWAIILAISTIIQAFCDLGIGNSIMVQEDDNEILSVYKVVSVLTVLICTISGILVLPYYILVKRNTLSEAFILCTFLIIYTITMKQVNTCYSWLNRYKKYDVLMKNPIINALTVALFSITLGVIGFTTYGYFLGMILGQLLTLINMRRHLPKTQHLLGFLEVKYVCRKNNYFIKYQMPSMILIQLRQWLPDILLGTLFGDAILGYYFVAIRILNIPVISIGQSLGKIFYQSISELKREGKEIGQFVVRNLSRATKISVIPLILLLAFGDFASVVFFGNNYIITGYILRLVIIKIFFIFVSNATQGLSIVMEQQKYTMINTFYQAIMGILSICIGYYLLDNVYIAIILSVITFSIIQISYFCKMIRVMKQSEASYIKDIMLALAVIILAAYLLRMISFGILDIFNWRHYFPWFRIL